MTETKARPEKVVEARVLRNTSRAGQLLIAGTVIKLPLSVAKSMRSAVPPLVEPVVRPIASHPAPPPPPPPTFEGEDATTNDEDNGDNEAEGGE